MLMPRPEPTAAADYSGDVESYEWFFTGLLVAITVLIGWVSIYILYRLYKG